MPLSWRRGGGVWWPRLIRGARAWQVDMDDPEFWTKILPEMETKDPVLAAEFLKRKSKQASVRPATSPAASIPRPRIREGGPRAPPAAPAPPRRRAHRR